MHIFAEVLKFRSRFYLHHLRSFVTFAVSFCVFVFVRVIRCFLFPTGGISVTGNQCVCGGETTNMHSENGEDSTAPKRQYLDRDMNKFVRKNNIIKIHGSFNKCISYKLFCGLGFFSKKIRNLTKFSRIIVNDSFDLPEKKK